MFSVFDSVHLYISMHLYFNDSDDWWNLLVN